MYSTTNTAQETYNEFNNVADSSNTQDLCREESPDINHWNQQIPLSKNISKYLPSFSSQQDHKDDEASNVAVQDTNTLTDYEPDVCDFSLNETSSQPEQEEWITKFDVNIF